MKKTVALVLALSIILALSACGASNVLNVPKEEPLPEDILADGTSPMENETVMPFRFSPDNFPVIDGSTAAKPLAVGAASVLLGIPREEADSAIEFHRTTQSFRNLSEGLCDILIAGEPSASVFEEYETAGFEYELEEIATDALIFVVNASNPVDSLTTEQLRGIYSGEIVNWSEVGGPDEEIVPFQRNEGAGSQALMLKHVMGETEMMPAPIAYVATEMGELMEAVRSYDNSASAIGYSVYYYANDMQKADGLKILAVDGVAPNVDTIRSKEYPHLNAYYSVISADEPEDSPARILFRWLMSGEGQELIAKEGYVASAPGSDADANVATDYSQYVPSSLTNQYSRLTEEPISDLAARDDYGLLYPYTGSPLYSGYTDENGVFQEHARGYLYGFADAQGRLVCDPTYTSVETLKYYDDDSSQDNVLGFWIMRRAEGESVHNDEYDYDYVDDKSTYAFASFSGEIVSECCYKDIFGLPNGFVAIDPDGGFSIFDASGTAIITDETLGLSDDIENIQVYTIDRKNGLYWIYLNDEMHHAFDDDGFFTGDVMSDNAYYNYGGDTWNTPFDGADSAWYPCGSNGFIAKDEENGVRVINTDTGAERFLEGAEYVYPFYTLYAEAPLPYLIAGSYSEETEKSHYMLLDKRLETLAEDDELYFSAVQDEMTANWFISRLQDNESALLDENLNVLCELPDVYRICNAKVVEINDRYCEIRTLDGEVLFRYLYPAGELD